MTAAVDEFSPAFSTAFDPPDGDDDGGGGDVVLVGITSRFPPSWRTTVTVERVTSDKHGNPSPGETFTVADCLVALESTDEDPNARSDLPETTVNLYTPPGVDIRSTDLIHVPDGPLWPSGTFQVDGRIARWPLGVRAPLREV